ncbi:MULTISPECIES: hypothetical protein [Sphingomonas]|uniref:hypothetical protein n=1 Tax=Sphingomonas TaxID=13687 RepID=UPI001269F56E|nr:MULTISPECIES: hypothetical protein [Sphingomonas]
MARLWPVLAAASLIACTNGSASAVTSATPAAPACTVSGADKFVERAGGAAAICAAVERAVHAQAPGQHHVEVKVLSATTMTATTRLADGRTLPDLHTAISDGTISPAMMDRFAQDIANQISSTLQHQGK